MVLFLIWTFFWKTEVIKIQVATDTLPTLRFQTFLFRVDVSNAVKTSDVNGLSC